MGRKLSAFKIKQLWWRKTTRNHIERLKAVGKWHGLPRLTLAEWTQRYEQFDHRCAYCLQKFDTIRDLWIEHLVGVGEGGTHRVENCVPACPKCNQQKGSKALVDFCGLTVAEFIPTQLTKIDALKASEKES
jgi:5-methylcytosine-specific restriction endonuclease McrA